MCPVSPRNKSTPHALDHLRLDGCSFQSSCNQRGTVKWGSAEWRETDKKRVHVEGKAKTKNTFLQALWQRRETTQKPPVQNQRRDRKKVRWMTRTFESVNNDRGLYVNEYAHVCMQVRPMKKAVRATKGKETDTDNQPIEKKRKNETRTTSFRNLLKS